MDIEWQEGAVCFSGGSQRFTHDGSYFMRYCLISTPAVNTDTTGAHLDWLLERKDFQLNTIKQGDYIEASELDTKQKYNDAVEAFCLFGFDEWAGSSGFGGLESYLYIDNDGEVINGGVHKKRPLTYSQLMAIGKLKRLMNERDNLKRRGEYSGCVKVDLGGVKEKEVAMQKKQTSSSSGYD